MMPKSCKTRQRQKQYKTVNTMAKQIKCGVGPQTKPSALRQTNSAPKVATRSNGTGPKPSPVIKKTK